MSDLSHPREWNLAQQNDVINKQKLRTMRNDMYKCLIRAMDLTTKTLLHYDDMHLKTIQEIWTKPSEEN